MHWLCMRLLRRNSYQPCNLVLVVPYNYFPVDIKYGHGHPTTLRDHFLTLFEVGLYVVVSKGNIVFLEEILRHVAEVTRRGAVNDDAFGHRNILSGSQYSMLPARSRLYYSSISPHGLIIYFTYSYNY